PPTCVLHAPLYVRTFVPNGDRPGTHAFRGGYVEGGDEMRRGDTSFLEGGALVCALLPAGFTRSEWGLFVLWKWRTHKNTTSAGLFLFAVRPPWFSVSGWFTSVALVRTHIWFTCVTGFSFLVVHEDLVVSGSGCLSGLFFLKILQSKTG